MFTSRAEYRLMLREDNADLRLMGKGHDIGLIDGDMLRTVMERKRQIQGEIERIKGSIIKPTGETNVYLEKSDTQPIKTGIALDRLLKRVELDYHAVETLAKSPDDIDKHVSHQVVLEIKYEGYIKRQLSEIERFKNLEMISIPEDFDFSDVHGLSNELKEKFSAIRPTSLGQASRVDGSTPVAISVLMIALKAFGRSKKNASK